MAQDQLVLQVCVWGGVGWEAVCVRVCVLFNGRAESAATNVLCCAVLCCACMYVRHTYAYICM